MAIVNIASYHEYANTVATQLSLTTVPHPGFSKVAPFWAGTLSYFNSTIEKTNLDIDPDQRPWFRVAPTASHSTSTTYGHLTVASTSIDADLKVPGTTIIFGFKFANASASLTGTYLGYRAPSTAAVVATTNLTAVPGITIAPNQFRWIDFVIKYKADNVVEVSIYADKELAYTFTTTYTTIWAVGAGQMGRTLINATNYNQGFYVNDFITIVDKDTDAEKSGDLGPVTVMELEIKTPQHNNLWTPSPGKTMKESLNNKLTENPIMFPDQSLIRSDPYGSEMITGFRAPVVEDRKMLAFQQYFLAQKPMSMGANLHYRPTINGVPQGDKITYETGTSTNAFRIFMPAVMLPATKAQADAIIESHGMAFSSTKKVIPL